MASTDGVSGADSSNNDLASTISSATGNQKMGEQDFLKLLMTQLTNQDPLSPQDQSQFMSQLAQFSTVEGINNMVTSTSRQQASNLLGKTVAAMIMKDDVATPVAGVVNAVSYTTDGVKLTVGTDDTVIDLSDVQLVTNTAQS